MVEIVINPSGIIEEDSSGQLFLTFRMSLTDFSSQYQFSTQEAGKGPFYSVSEELVGTGSDSNGSTKDIKIPISDINAVIRVSMFVEPMGRSVVYYLSFSQLSEIQSQEAKIPESQRAVPEQIKPNLDKESGKEIDKTSHPKSQDKKTKHHSKSQKASKVVGLEISHRRNKQKTQSPNKRHFIQFIYYLPTVILILSVFIWLLIKKRQIK